MKLTAYHLELALYAKGINDYQGCDLEGIDLKGMKLLSFHFENANLKNANFQDAVLRGTVFSGANLEEANFQGADLYGTYFLNANLTNAKFLNANLAYARCSGANLTGTNLPEPAKIHAECNLPNAYMDDTEIDIAKVPHKTVLDIIRQGKQIRRPYMQNLKADEFLAEYKLGMRDFRYIALRGCDFGSVNLQNINLRGAFLVDTNLSAANLAGSDLGGVSFRNVNLDNAMLTGAWLCGTEFYDSTTARNADFRWVKMENARIEDSVFSGARFNEGRLSAVEIRKSCFRRVDLSSTRLRGALLEDCDFAASNLSGTDFKNTTISQVDFSGAFFNGEGFINWQSIDMVMELLCQLWDSDPVMMEWINFVRENKPPYWKRWHCYYRKAIPEHIWKAAIRTLMSFVRQGDNAPDELRWEWQKLTSGRKGA